MRKRSFWHRCLQEILGPVSGVLMAVVRDNFLCHRSEDFLLFSLVCSVFEYFVLSAISLPGYQLGWLGMAKWHLALPLDDNTQKGPMGRYSLWGAYICPGHSCFYTNISGSQWLDARVGAEQYSLGLDSAQPVSSTSHEMGSREDNFDSSGSSSILQDRLCKHWMLWHQGTLHRVRL